MLFVLTVMSLYIYTVDIKRYKKLRATVVDPRVMGITCDKGFCITNVQTGIKRCPSENVEESYNVVTETCNPRFLCTSIRTEHPLGLSGATLLGTKCENGVSCNCSALPRCSRDRASVFLVADDPRDSRVYVEKNTPGGVVVPMGYRLLCDTPIHLAEEVFGCKMTDTKSIHDCIAGSKGSVACPYGTAAISLSDTGFGTAYCVYKPPCPAEHVLYYDEITTKSLCLTVDQTGTSV